MAGAAFFDLDRTLLRGASGPVLSNALRSAGIGGAKAIPGERFVYRLFNLVGENLPSMALARQGPRLAKGRKADAVPAAAGDAAHHPARAPQRFPPKAFTQHP